MVTSFADISHYQSVDLAAYKAGGYDRIVMKATGGATDGTLRFVDPTFIARWRHAGELGLARVAYHFARNNNSGYDEFAWCWGQIHAAGGMTGRDVLCYDQEDNRSPQTIALARQRTREFVAAAVKAGVVTGWVYSGRWFLEPAGIAASDVPSGWRQLWISDYTPGQADDAIEVPAGWARAHIVARQYADNAGFPGIPAPCDANRVIREWLEDDVTAAEVWAQAIPVPDSAKPLFARDSYTAAELLMGPNIRGAMLAQQVTAVSGAVGALSKLVAAADNDLTAEQVEAAVEAGVASALQANAVHVDISVAGQPAPPASA